MLFAAVSCRPIQSFCGLASRWSIHTRTTEPREIFFPGRGSKLKPSTTCTSRATSTLPSLCQKCEVLTAESLPVCSSSIRKRRPCRLQLFDLSDSGILARLQYRLKTDGVGSGRHNPVLRGHDEETDGDACTYDEGRRKPHAVHGLLRGKALLMVMYFFILFDHAQ